MSSFRVIQISDTHLSRQKSWFVPNFEAIARIVAARRPDLVLNTGDMALDATEREDDLAFARECHDALVASVRAIPGNHDVGDNRPPAGAGLSIDDERLKRYRRYFGDDYWMIDGGAWTLVGLNGQLFGSGLPAEEEQWSFLASVPTRAKSRPIALFVHKPLFLDDPAEAEVGKRFITPDHRRRLRELLRDATVRLVATGHVHQHRRRDVEGIDYCWAPSTAYVLPDGRQPRFGEKRVGYVEYAFEAGRVEINVVEAPELANHNLADFPDAYAH